LQFVVGEKIGGGSLIVTAKYALRWEFVSGVLNPYEAGKVGHRSEPSMPFGLGTRLSRPVNCGLAADMRLALGTGKAGKIPEISLR
jgi:hypothetical protein